mgnify:CR=1 FL=1
MGTNEFMGKGMAGLYTVAEKNSKRKPFVKSDIRVPAFDSYLNAGTQVSDEDAYAMASKNPQLRRPTTRSPTIRVRRNTTRKSASIPTPT